MNVLIIGLGNLGGVVLELLAREEGIGRIVAASRDPVRGEARVNLARLGALAQGRSPDVEFAPLDVDDGAAVGDLLRREAPDVIVMTASLETWWLPDLLPEPARVPLARAGFGGWVPVHLALPLALMRTLAATGYAGHVVTAPFPDVVNAVLGRLGIAPTCGVGNLDEIVPKIRHLAARRLRAPVGDIGVTLVAHHALERLAFGAGAPADLPPHFLRVSCRGRDVTDDVEAEALLRAPYPLAWGPVMHFLTAGSTVRLVRALGSDAPVALHAPGPAGLPGGYPILASRRGVTLAPIDGLEPGEAVALNEQSHRFDGIDRIEDDGTVVFTAGTASVLREVLGYDGARLAPGEARPRATELLARFREYAARHGVDVDRARRQVA
jgi:hypothetical protein